MTAFSDHIRKLREMKQVSDSSYSLRKVAGRIGVEPSYLSKVERGDVPPSEKLVASLASELGEDADILALLAGKIPAGFIELVQKHPHVFIDFFRQVKSRPNAILRVVREVRDGKW